MKRTIGWTLLLCGIAVSSFGVSGCAHPCGYIDVHSRVTALESQARREWLSGAPVLKLDHDVSATDANVEARLVRDEALQGLASEATYGRRVYVPYQWYTPIVKPVLSVTVIFPLWKSASSPHSHGLGSPNALDYCRDVVSWFNWFSALPTGPRRVKIREGLIRSEVVYTTIEERSVPIAAQAVSLYLDGVEVGEALSDASGRVRFDLTQQLSAIGEAAEHHLALVSMDDSGKVVEHRWTVERAVWRALLSARDSGGQ